MTTTKPRIRVRKATPADTDAIVDINFAAFADGVISKLMYPNGPSEDSKKKFAARFILPPPEPRTGEPTPKPAALRGEPIMCVAELLPEGGPEDAPGEVVAFARWNLQREPRPADAPEDPPFVATVETHGEGCNLDVMNAFIGKILHKSAQHHKGEACLYLSILACSPARQRTGAGSALVRWGSELADSLGLPCRLEASAVGYGLYRKCGYEDLDVVDIRITELWGVTNTDGANWGENNALAVGGPVAQGCYRNVIMRRPPKLATV